MQSRRSVKHLFSALFLTAFLLIAAVSAYLSQLSNFIDERVFERLSETALTQAEDFNALLDRNYLVLESLASHLSALGDMHAQSAVTLLNGTRKTAGFFDVAVSDASGQTLFADGQLGCVANRYYYQAALGGRRAIERIETDVLRDRTLFVLSVPLYRGGAVAGTVFGAYEPAALDAFLNVTAFRGNAQICILDADFRRIAASFTADDRFSDIEKLLNTNASPDALSPDQILANVRSGESGSGRLTALGEDYCIGFAPLGINGWFLFSVVPAAAANSEYRPVYTMTWALIGSLAAIFVLLTTFFSVFYRRSRDEMARAYQDLNVLNDGLPGGVFKLRIDDRLTLLYENEGFCRMTGYSPDEMRLQFDAAFLPMIHADDRETVLRNLRDALRREGLVQQRLRLCKKDGSVIWVSAQYRYVIEHTGEVAYGMMLDISKQVLSELETELTRKKYRLAIEHTAHVFLEYDIPSRTLRSEDKKRSLYNLPAETTNMPEGRIASGEIDEGSVDEYRAMYDAIHRGEPYASADIQLHPRGTADAVWVHIDMTTLFDETAKPIRAVAILQNITKEKRADHDALTGLSNRASAESSIRETLLSSAPGSLHAFVMFDLDNFKNVNDTCGHLEGDNLLRQFSSLLQYHFRAGDVLARFGGDEFAVFIRDLREAGHAVSKVHDVLENAAKLQPAGSDEPLSVSAGVAFYPADGDSFETLYTHADAALYRAKNAGKCRLSVYGD